MIVFTSGTILYGFKSFFGYETKVTCSPGYGEKNNRCVECEENHYSLFNKCIPCPLNMISSKRSDGCIDVPQQSTEGFNNCHNCRCRITNDLLVCSCPNCNDHNNCTDCTECSNEVGGIKCNTCLTCE